MNQVLQDIRNLLSLNNLKQAKISGQIATLLMLIIAAVLIFILVTVNLGNISLQATSLSNAADSASLYLASQLATKANYLKESLRNKAEDRYRDDPPRICQRTGLLAVVLAVIFAIVGYFFAPYLSPFMGAVIGGTVGGAIGGGIVQGGATGIFQGAIQGMMIGAAIGGGIEYGAKIGAARAGAGGATVAIGEIGTDLVTVPVGAFGSIPPGVLMSGSTLAVPGAITGGVLGAGGNIFNEAMAEKRMLANFTSLVKELNKLPEYFRYREGIFLQVLSQTVDDPTKTNADFTFDCNKNGVIDDNERGQGDPCDIDGDGNTEETLPYFQYWWARRVESLKGMLPDLERKVKEFVDEVLSVFQETALATYTGSGIFSRKEIEGSDGAATELLRALYDAPANYKVGWEPGPSESELEASECGECDTPPPASYDEIDLTIDVLKEFAGDPAKGEEGKGDVDRVKEQELSKLVSSLSSWAALFFDPDADATEAADYYHRFYDLIYGGGDLEGLNALKNEIEMTKQTLPQCEYDYPPPVDTTPPVAKSNFTLSAYTPGGAEAIGVKNWPCKDADFATIDADLDDEFIVVRDELNNFINKMEDFRQAALSFYMNNIYTTDNSLTYNWQDSRGEQSIKVEVGPFRIPQIVKRRSGNWLVGRICLTLIDYHDDGSNTWVKITRKEPESDKEVKSGTSALGKWNPSPYKGEISRTSHAYYNLNGVGIQSRD